MQSLNKNGVSITQTPGRRKIREMLPRAHSGDRFIFNMTTATLTANFFSTVAKTLAECRRRRDGWIAKKNRVISKF